MIIKTILSQTRRDFTAIYLCEHCGHEEQGEGYDDDHFHNKFVHTIVCLQCMKTSDKETFRARCPKYDGNEVI